VENIALGIGALYTLGILATIMIIVYLIIKRVNAKKSETFEKRDN
jgi:uncharacterized membrane protein